MNKYHKMGYDARKSYKSNPPQQLDLWKHHDLYNLLPDAEAREDWTDGWGIADDEITGIIELENE